MNTNLNTFFFSINAYNITKAKCFQIFHFLCKMFLFRGQWNYFFLRQCYISFVVVVVVDSLQSFEKSVWAKLSAHLNVSVGKC